MKRTLLLLPFLLSLSTSFPVQAQQPSTVLYDNFNHRFLSPIKWATSSPCFTWTVLDCAREIRNGQLRLVVRGFGATDSNTGNQYGESELHFTNPSRIKSIATEITVRRTKSANCPANAEPNSGTQAILQGTFFNSGSGDTADDVQALFFLNHLPTDPQGVLTAVALLQWQGQFFGGAELGTVNVGQRITAQLIWNRSNHQFLAAWTDLASGRVMQTSMPYTMSDTTAAAAPDKLLGVRVFTPNCVGTQMLADDMETTFDNVMIGR